MRRLVHTMQELSCQCVWCFQGVLIDYAMLCYFVWICSCLLYCSKKSCQWNAVVISNMILALEFREVDGGEELCAEWDMPCNVHGLISYLNTSDVIVQPTAFL